MTSPGEQPPPISPEAEARVRELQGLITDFQRRADKAEDEDIREALNLQVSKLGLIISRIRQGLPEALPSESEPAEDENFEPLPQPTPQQQEEADKLVQRAMLEKRRGNNQAANDLLRQASETAPGSATVLEALGDDYLERKNYGKAHETYRLARRADPKNASIEKKYAELSMHVRGNMSMDEHLMMALADSTFINPEEAMASPKIATLLSVFIPGAGQFALGYTKKAFVFLGIFLASAIMFVAVTHFLKEPRGLHPLAYLPLAVGIATWLGSVMDCTSTGKKIDRGNRPNRPPPPVNLPFE
jgi:tetratricopeptide (TPR) repeat protein